MKLPTTNALATGFPLVIPTKTQQPTARLLLRGGQGQIVQQWLVQQNKCTLGSAASCSLKCELPGIAPYHALLVIGARQIFIRALAPKLTRDGRPFNEILLTDADSHFEIAGHLFELTRGGEQVRAAVRQENARPERLKFTLARPFELQKRSPSTPAPLPHTDAPTLPNSADHAPSSDSKWVAQLIQAAMQPLECQLHNLLEPLSELQSDSRKTKSLRRKRKAAKRRAAAETTISTLGERVPQEPAPEPELPPQFALQVEQLVASQAAAMDVLTERICDVTLQLSAIERLVAEERQASAPPPPAHVGLELASDPQWIQQNASIEQLQQGIVAVSSALQGLQSRQADAQQDDQLWRSTVQTHLDGLSQVIENLSDTVSQVHQVALQSAAEAVSVRTALAALPPPAAGMQFDSNDLGFHRGEIDSVTHDAEPNDVATYDVESNEVDTGDVEPNDVATDLAEPNDVDTGDVEPNDVVAYDAEPNNILCSVEEGRDPNSQENVENAPQASDQPFDEFSRLTALSGEESQDDHLVCSSVITSPEIAAVEADAPNEQPAAEDALLPDVDERVKYDKYSSLEEDEHATFEESVESGYDAALGGPHPEPESDIDSAEEEFFGLVNSEASASLILETSEPLADAIAQDEPGWDQLDQSQWQQPDVSSPLEEVEPEGERPQASAPPLPSWWVDDEPDQPLAQHEALELAERLQSVTASAQVTDNVEPELSEDDALPSLLADETVEQAAEVVLTPPAADDTSGLSGELSEEFFGLAQLAPEEHVQAAPDDSAAPSTAPTALAVLVEGDDVLEEGDDVLEESLDSASVASEDDDSVEEYMRKLLARMRGVSESEVELPKSAPTPAAARIAPRATTPSPTNRPTEVSSPQGRPTTSTVPATGPYSVDATEPFDPEKYMPRALAPERSKSLAAMRELANSSARTAIHKSTRQRHVSSILLKAVIAIVGALVGTVLLAINGFNLNIGLVATFASFLVAAIWGYDSVSSIRPMLQAGLVLKPQTSRPTSTKDEADEK